MDCLLAAVDRASRAGRDAACVCVALATGLILAEIVARKVFGTSISFAWEFASYFSAAAFLLGAGYALSIGAHMRVQLLLDALPPRGARALDLGATLGATAFAGYFAWALGLLAWHSFVDGTRSFLPSNVLLYPFQMAFALGALLLALQALARLVRLWRGEAVQ